MNFLDTLNFLAESIPPFLNDSSSSSSSSSPFSSSSSEDEDDYLYRAKRTRIENFMDVISNYNDEEFRSHFRLKRNIITPLIDRISHLFNERESGWPAVSAEMGLYVLLWYIANKETFRQIADRFGITESCTHGIIRKLTRFFSSISHEFISWPNLERKQRSALGHERKHGLKRVIGCIDGSHISINKPREHAEDYLNRKKYYSILLQGTVDHSKRFINIYVGEPGSMHDARMLRKSKLFHHAETHDILDDFCLLGDSAYPSLRWLVPPFKDNGNLTENQRLFNYRHSATRIIVEHAFGLLKGRFRRLQHFDNRDLHLINQCIVTACILHNMCIDIEDLGDDLHLINDNMLHDEPHNVGQNEQARERMFLEMFQN